MQLKLRFGIFKATEKCTSKSYPKMFGQVLNNHIQINCFSLGHNRAQSAMEHSIFEKV